MNNNEERTAAAYGRWIPVEERLPEEFESVLIHVPGDAPLPTVHEAYMVKDCWVAKVTIYMEREVTHWMEMPEPPIVGAQ